MNRGITLYEHQFLPYTALSLPMKEAILDAIEGLNATAGCEILRLEWKGLRAMGRVGLVRVGEVSIEILPRIDAPARDLSGAPGAAARSLLTMLSYAYAFPIQAQTAAAVQAEPGGWFELLTRIFTTQLHQQLAAGAACQYVAREDTLAALRGRWDLGRQVRRPPHERHHFEVSYEELTFDTPLNQVLRFVVEALSLLSSDPSNLALLADLRGRLHPVAVLPAIPPDLLGRVEFNRVNERFRPVFTLARLFLEGNILRLRCGDFPAYAFVFDMSRLFERFVAGFLLRFRGQILPPAWQDAQVFAQSAGARVFLASCQGRGVLRLIPDVVLRPRDGILPLLVMDTKYKPQQDADRGRGEIDREDAYQMMAYLVRLECRRGLLLYPQAEGRPKVRQRWEMKTPGLDLYACTLDLHARLERPEFLIQEMAEIFGWMTGEIPAGSL